MNTNKESVNIKIAEKIVSKIIKLDRLYNKQFYSVKNKNISNKEIEECHR